MGSMPDACVRVLGGFVIGQSSFETRVVGHSKRFLQGLDARWANYGNRRNGKQLVLWAPCRELTFDLYETPWASGSFTADDPMVVFGVHTGCLGVRLLLSDDEPLQDLAGRLVVGFTLDLRHPPLSSEDPAKSR